MRQTFLVISKLMTHYVIYNLIGLDIKDQLQLEEQDHLEITQK